MLSEYLLASISASTHSSAQSSTGAIIPPVKDAAIFKLAVDPNSRHVPTIYKASSTPQNALAYSPSHIFAAQTGKAVVNAYNVERGTQEATIPFPEKITALITTGATGEYVILGSESGSVWIWETSSGRLLKAELAHIQRVTAIAIDSSGHFFLTGSSDSTILVWSLLNVLTSEDATEEWQSEQGRRPLQSLTSHRAPISAISTGHSPSASNISVSISEDRMALVWHYAKGVLLRSYLLDDIPQSIELDPADRAFYVGFQSGCVQMVTLYNDGCIPFGVSYPVAGSINDTAIQPSKVNYWVPPVVATTSTKQLEFGATLSLSLNFDGSRLLSGHESGRICVWDVSQGQFEKELYVLPGPVTNMSCLSPIGFMSPSKSKKKLHAICKPKINSNAKLDISITTELLDYLNDDLERPLRPISFSEALSQQYFPDEIIWEAIQEQRTESETRNFNGKDANELRGTEEFISLNDNNIMTSERRVHVLEEQLASLQRTQKESFKTLSQMRRERDVLIQQLKQDDLANPGKDAPVVITKPR